MRLCTCDTCASRPAVWSFDSGQGLDLCVRPEPVPQALRKPYVYGCCALKLCSCRGMYRLLGGATQQVPHADGTPTPIQLTPQTWCCDGQFVLPGQILHPCNRVPHHFRQPACWQSITESADAHTPPRTRNTKMIPYTPALKAVDMSAFILGIQIMCLNSYIESTLL
jgi:hypothetical protein